MVSYTQIESFQLFTSNIAAIIGMKSKEDLDELEASHRFVQENENGTKRYYVLVGDVLYHYPPSPLESKPEDIVG